MSSSLTRTLLALAALCTTLGLARYADAGWGPLFSWFWSAGGYDEEHALQLLQRCAWIAVCIAPLAALRPFGILGLALVAWSGAWCAATMWEGAPFAAWAPATHATRIAVPLSLVCLACRWHAPGPRWNYATAILLVVASSAVFAAHGYEAYQAHPEFIDFVLLVARARDFVISESEAIQVLHVIGIADLTVAALALLACCWNPARYVLLWMFVWGLMTALLRPYAYGTAFYADALLRAPNALAPAAAFFLLRSSPPSLPKIRC